MSHTDTRSEMGEARGESNYLSFFLLRTCDPATFSDFLSSVFTLNKGVWRGGGSKQGPSVRHLTGKA